MKLSEYTEEMCLQDYNSENDQRILRAIEYKLHQINSDARSGKNLRYFEDDSMDIQKLLEELEGLRIRESSYFDVSKRKREAYDRANEMLDDCIEIVKTYQ